MLRHTLVSVLCIRRSRGVRVDVVTHVEIIMREFVTTAAGENWFYYPWKNIINDLEYHPEVKITTILDPLSEAAQK